MHILKLFYIQYLLSCFELEHNLIFLITFTYVVCVFLQGMEEIAKNVSKEMFI